MGISREPNLGCNGDMRILPAVVMLTVLIGCRHGPPIVNLPVAVSKPDRVAITVPPRETLPDTIRIVDPPPPLPTDTGVVRAKPSEDAAIGKVNASLEDVFFPYDRAELSSGALAILARDADLLRTLLAEFPGVTITVEGHCDERGSAEYNLALGDRRAHRAADILRDKGVPEASLHIVSYGKELPQCTESSESCLQRNRRVHLTARIIPGSRRIT
jgi:outer membrane protein OmpA-like peptidoglycan-associated protein